jgi:hypothetical protein
MRESLKNDVVIVRSRRYLGFIDVNDLAYMVLRKPNPTSPASTARSAIPGVFDELGSVFGQIDRAINLSGKDEFFGLPSAANLAEVCAPRPVVAPSSAPSSSLCSSPRLCVSVYLSLCVSVSVSACLCMCPCPCVCVRVTRTNAAVSRVSALGGAVVSICAWVTTCVEYHQAARVMGEKRAQRVAIIDNTHDNRVDGIITQSTVLRIVNDNVDVLGSVGKTQVGTLFPTCDPSEILCLPVTTTARRCLEVLLEFGYEGCPLVDECGEWCRGSCVCARVRVCVRVRANACVCVRVFLCVRACLRACARVRGWVSCGGAALHAAERCSLRYELLCKWQYAPLLLFCSGLGCSA